MNTLVSDERQRSTALFRYLRAPERIAVAKILLLASLTVSVLFLWDAGVFRTFYVSYLDPASYAGDFESALKMGRAPLYKRPHLAVVMGDSQIAEGFSAQLADPVGERSGWEFLNASVPGSSLRSWYYLIRDLDPDRSRFDVVVLPLRGYPDVDDGEVRANREEDLRWMIGRLRISDLPEFTASFPDRTAQLNVIRQGLFKGLVFRRDVREFLRKPRTRLRDLEACQASCSQSSYEYPGRDEDLTGLYMDWATNTIHFPPGTRPEVRDEMRAHSNYRDWAVHGVEQAYRKAWFGRIIARYRGTRTRIAIISLPYRPFPIRLSWPMDSNSFVVEAAKDPNVVVFEEHLFDDLQRPDYFWDVFHMNRTGRAAFSTRLVTTLIQKMDPQDER